jgi:hypothetical protein
MFDFRYHALSLTAVFVALALGLLLGVAIGDSGLVSSADRKLRNSLHADVRKANDRADAIQKKLDKADRFADQAYPLLTGDRLASRNLGLVFMGSASKDIDSDVKDALRDTGARLRSVAVIGEPLDLEALAGKAKGSRYENLAVTPTPDLDLVEDYGFRMGAQYTTPGRLMERSKSTLFDVFNGPLEPLSGVVIYYNPGDLDKVPDSVRDRFDKGFVAGIRGAQVPVVGVETTTTKPSIVHWYQDRKISSVDNVDEVAGHAALVFALVGAQGTFGERNGATLLPDFTP